MNLDQISGGIYGMYLAEVALMGTCKITRDFEIMMESLLENQGFSKKDFNLRLAIGCLKTLKKEIPVNGGNKEVQKYRKRVLNLLDKSLEII